jgi:Putative peptidoglycan binding domain/D-alanyl-D-alanine carboxypeptidase
MAVPLLRPGQTHAAVPRLKQALIPQLVEMGAQPLASLIRPDTKTYGKAAVNGVKKFQEKKGLDVDGVVGKDTWRALGVDDEVVDGGARKVLNGVPGPESGVVEFDGRWVDEALAAELLAVRKAGHWTGTVFSGYRPPWYQKRLFDAAVIKYGSEAAARKWVAPPGKSRHGKKGGQGAVDVAPANSGAQLDQASERLFRPMSWEPWHVQLSTRDAPSEEMEEATGDELKEPAAELEESGVGVDDVDDTIAVYLESLETDHGGPPEGGSEQTAD